MAGTSGNSSDNFNPEARLPGAQDFSGYSKGFTDNSAGTALTGLAGTLNDGISALDRGVDQMAKDDVDAAVNGADSKLLGINNVTPAADPLDKEVRKQVQNFGDKKLAMDNGTIDAEHYYGLLAAKAKNLRATYAGYNDTIDEEFKKMGIDPNWQRNQILKEGERAQAAKASAANEYDKDQREYFERANQDNKMIMDPDTRVKIFSNPMAYKDPQVMATIRAAQARTANFYSNIEANKATAEAKSSTDASKATDLSKNYDDSLQLVLHASSTNSGAQDLLTKAQTNAQKEADANGGHISAETEVQLRQAYSKFRQNFEETRQRIRSQYATDTPGLSENFKKVDDAVNAQLDNIGQGIFNKDWGVASYNTAYSTARVEGATANLNTSDQVVADQAGRKALGDTYFATVAGTDLDALKPVLKFHATGVLLDQAKDATKSFNDRMTDARKQGITDPKFYRTTFKQGIDTIASPDAAMPGRISVFKTMFSDANKGWWDNMDKNAQLTDADRRQYFGVMTSPNFQKGVKELAQNDRTVMPMYKQYVDYMFQKMNKDSASNINDTIASSSTATVTQNQSSGKLAVVPVSNPNTTAVAHAFDTVKNSAAANAVENFNAGVDALTPLWKEEHIDPVEGAKAYAKAIGLNLDQPKVGNAVDQLYNSKKGPKVQDLYNNGGGIQPSHLGGPQEPQIGGVTTIPKNVDPTVPDFGNPALASALAAHSPEALDARNGIIKEIADLQGLVDKTLDPARRAEYVKEIDSLLGDYRKLRGPTPTGGPNTKDGKPEAGLQDATSPLDLLPGKVAITGLAKGAATILPFVGREAAAIGEKVLTREGGASITTAAELEAMRAAKGVENFKANLPPDWQNAVAESAAGMTSAVESRAIHLAETKTPNEIGKRINQLEDFLNVAKDEKIRASYMKELEPLHRARKIILERMGVVK